MLAVLGHIFPAWLKFIGGKGVATTLGILIALNIHMALVFIFVWLAVFSVSRHSSLAYLASTVADVMTSGLRRS